jgi:hypothetical protein
MQIIYAAPFLLIAAIGFFVCAAIRPFRKHALVVPFGILSFGVGSLTSYFFFALIAYKLGHLGPANWLYLSPYLLGGLVIAICCTIIYRMVVSELPTWLISTGLVAATFASLLVLLPLCTWSVGHFIKLDPVHIGWMGIPGLVWLTTATFVSWRILRITEQFRPAPCLARVITRIFPHHDTSRGNEHTI